MIEKWKKENEKWWWECEKTETKTIKIYRIFLSKCLCIKEYWIERLVENLKNFMLPRQWI